MKHEHQEISDRAPAYTTLSRLQQKALSESMCILYEQYLEDLACLRDGLGFGNTLMASALPPRFAPLYDGLFAKKFFASFVSAMERIRNGERPRSVAEEMAVSEIFTHALALVRGDELYDQGTAGRICRGLEEYQHELQEDGDFLLLWDGRFGAPDSLGELGTVNLEPHRWFTAFREHLPVNPYAEEV